VHGQRLGPAAESASRAGFGPGTNGRWHHHLLERSQLGGARQDNLDHDSVGSGHRFAGRACACAEQCSTGTTAATLAAGFLHGITKRARTKRSTSGGECSHQYSDPDDERACR
jgi:hypothetical protein